MSNLIETDSEVRKKFFQLFNTGNLSKYQILFEGFQVLKNNPRLSIRDALILGIEAHFSY